ncbi:hypothetical protein [Klebsiella pneumoniae]|uniref:hypothetical protein n=1 Tax=Klebsiella pneumoniae TaxID=573 RepID=UPI003531D296
MHHCCHHQLDWLTEKKRKAHMLANDDVAGWWVDSGAMRHIAKTKEDAIQMKELSPGEQKVYMGNNSYCDVMGVGSYKLNVGAPM